MDEASIPQNNNDLNAEKGPGCDIRHRFALSTVYDIPAYRRTEWLRLTTQNWHFLAIYQIQSGMPLTISVFGDTANSGTVLGENPIRANADRRAGVRAWHAHRGRMVSSGGIRYTSRFHVWQRRAQFRIWTGYADHGHRAGAQLFHHGKTTFQFRAEAFNALNKGQSGTPNRFVNTPQFGTITMAMTPGREIQLSARFRSSLTRQ